MGPPTMLLVPILCLVSQVRAAPSGNGEQMDMGVVRAFIITVYCCCLLLLLSMHSGVWK